MNETTNDLNGISYIFNELDPELKFWLEHYLSQALEILDPFSKIGSKERPTKAQLRKVRELIWSIEGILTDEGLIHTPNFEKQDKS